jgi:hypothetical protein
VPQTLGTGATLAIHLDSARSSGALVQLVGNSVFIAVGRTAVLIHFHAFQGLRALVAVSLHTVAVFVGSVGGAASPVHLDPFRSIRTLVPEVRNTVLVRIGWRAFLFLPRLFDEPIDQTQGVLKV